MKELQQLVVLTGLSATVSDVDAHKQFREPSERVSESPGVVTQPRSGRSGLHSISNLVDAYMAAYAGRDPTRPHHLRWWQQRLGDSTLDTIDQDDIYLALEELSTRAGRYCAGRDADGKPIFKAKRVQYSPATINRYAAALSALFSWCIRKRLAPKAWTNPCRGIERRREDNDIEAMIVLIGSGLYKGLLPSHIAAILKTRYSIKRLRGSADFTHPMCAITNKRKPLSRKVEVFLSVLKELHTMKAISTA